MAQLMPLPLTVSCFSKSQIGFTFLVPAHLGSPGKGPLNGCVVRYTVYGMFFMCFWVVLSCSVFVQKTPKTFFKTICFSSPAVRPTAI